MHMSIDLLVFAVIFGQLFHLSPSQKGLVGVLRAGRDPELTLVRILYCLLEKQSFSSFYSLLLRLALHKSFGPILFLCAAPQVLKEGNV